MSVKYAVVENDIVINVILADEYFVSNNLPNAILCPDEIGVGDLYVNGEFSLNRIVVEENEIGETL